MNLSANGGENSLRGELAERHQARQRSYLVFGPREHEAEHRFTQGDCEVNGRERKWRRVGKLLNPRVPEYTALDLRYAWKVRRDTELWLAIQNAAERWHPEFRTSNALPSEIERSVLAGVRWSL